MLSRTTEMQLSYRGFRNLGFYAKNSPRNSWSPYFIITHRNQKSQNAGISFMLENFRNCKYIQWNYSEDTCKIQWFTVPCTIIYHTKYNAEVLLYFRFTVFLLHLEQQLNVKIQWDNCKPDYSSLLYCVHFFTCGPYLQVFLHVAHICSVYALVVACCKWLHCWYLLGKV